MYGEIRRLTWDRITIEYLRVVHGDLRQYTEKKKRSFTVLVHGGRIKFPFYPVYDRIPHPQVTEIYDRNTITCITAKYVRIMNVYGRLGPYTQLLRVNLGEAVFHEFSAKTLRKLAVSDRLL